MKSYLRGNFPSVRNDVEDIAQESYLRVWKARSQHPIRSARSFLFEVARNLAKDLLRRSATFRPQSLGDFSQLSVIDGKPTALENLTAQEKLDLLTDAVVSLPSRCREVILLHKLQGLSQREVAKKLHLSERTVENHTRLALIKCEAYLRKRGLEGFQAD